MCVFMPQRRNTCGILSNCKMILATLIHWMLNSQIHYKAGEGLTPHASSLPTMTLSWSLSFISDFVSPCITLYFPGTAISLHISFFFPADQYSIIHMQHISPSLLLTCLETASASLLLQTEKQWTWAWAHLCGRMQSFVDTQAWDSWAIIVALLLILWGTSKLTSMMSRLALTPTAVDKGPSFLHLSSIRQIVWERSFQIRIGNISKLFELAFLSQIRTLNT